MGTSKLTVGFVMLCAALALPRYAAGLTLPGDTTVQLAAGTQTAPAIASGGSTLLAVWSDGRANPYGGYEYETSGDIYGMRLDANGNPLDAVPIAIATRRATQENPKVVWNGTNWLVVFDSYMVGGTGYYYDKGLQAVRVSPAGQVLDPEPITLYGLRSTGGYYWTVASDGNNWVVACQGTSASYDIVAVRISPEGVVLDPPTRSLVDGTYYMRSNLKLAYAAGVFLLTFDDAYNNGGYDTKAVRFDRTLTLLTPTPFQLLPSSLSALAANGTGFYIAWNRQNPDYSVVVAGSRVNTAGQRLDGNGISISGTKQPYGYATTAVAWDGLNWRVTWGEYSTTWIARVNAAGTLLDPGSIAVAGPQTGPSAGNGAGGVQLVWSTFASNNYDVQSANIAANSTAGPNRALSVGAPQQLKADIATSGNGYMVVYSSATAPGARVLAQPLDAAGNALTAGPIELDSGLYPNVPSAPNVAWSSNSSVYLVAWSNSNGVVAQRLRADGTKLDPAPFVVMNPAFGPADVAAIGDTFLIIGRFSPYHEIINTIAARVRGSDGVVLDPTPLNLGGVWVARVPAVTAVGGRFFVAFHSNATHDNSAATTLGVFVPVTGANAPAFAIYGFSTGGGNGIFEIGLASDGNQALVVQSAEITSGVENDMLARFVAADGTLGPVMNLTPWAGNQYRPRAAWDGGNFIVVFQDQKNRLAESGLEQLDARSDLFGMRISATGTVLDPQGFLISASPIGETDPTICSAGGVSLIAASFMTNDAASANYRIGYDILSANGPRAVINASTTAGDIPLTVNFDSGNGFGVPLTYAWDFGDGSTSGSPNPSHTFTVVGEYLVTLTVTDELGRQTAQAQMINATRPNQIPIAVASADQTSGNAPLSVIFSAEGSYDPDGFVGNIEWRFSDGGIYYGSTAYHTFTTVGDHTVTLLAYDSRGGTGTTTLTIHVGGVNQPPLANASATPTSGNAPLTVAFSSAGSSDPDGTIAAYQWNFGDAFGYTSNEPNPTYTYGYAGTYTATLTVTDNNNVSSTDTVVITVSPDPTTLLRSTAITLSAKLSGSKVTATGQVTVKDGNGKLISGASVTAQWTRPDGSTVVQSVTTRGTGVAQFQASGGRGTYTLTVTDIYKYLYTFDPAGSVLTKSITK